MAPGTVGAYAIRSPAIFGDGRVDERNGRNFGVDAIGTGDDRQREREVVEVAGERSEAREDADGSGNPRRKTEEPRHGHTAFGGLEAVDAAEMRGQPDRAAQVRDDLERRQAGRDRRRGASTRSAGRSLEVPRIRRAAEDRIRALIVGEERRDVRVADDDRARRPETGRDGAVLVGNAIEAFAAERRPQTGDVVAVLESERDAVERTPDLPTRERAVGGRGLPSGRLDVERHDRVQRGIPSLDAGEMPLEGLDGRQLTTGNPACQIFRRQRGHLTLMCQVHGHIVATRTDVVIVAAPCKLCAVSSATAYSKHADRALGNRRAAKAFFHLFSRTALPSRSARARDQWPGSRSRLRSCNHGDDFLWEIRRWLRYWQRSPTPW